MRTVILDVQPLRDALTDLGRGWNAGKRRAPRVSFHTLDRDLLRLGEVDGVRIVRPREFLRELS
jgi:hypothetical protein